MTDRFELFSFQEVAAESLRQAALNWVAHAAASGVPKYGPNPIPFVGQIKAVTGSGKTPMLADVVAGVGDAVVIWTSKSAVVVEQTYNNLRGRYRSLLPGDARIMRQIPSQPDWNELLSASTGLSIWVLTTASWNEAEAAARGGADDARLSLHRPQPDWSGETSPWELLRTSLKRPLWIVSDESHNQSATQLDQLAALRPVGFFLASATPIQNELFGEWQKALDTDPEWARLSAEAVVPVRTRDVVAAGLLKTTIELYDNNSGYEEDLDGVLATMSELDEAVFETDVSVNPKAIYVVEKSNPPRGSTEEARPVAVWRYLRAHGVPAENIAVFTRTKDLPDDAESMTSLTQLEDRHRHIIFNQALQEGWDDPEAYVCYFDGTTESFVRIRQIVGRILRQPGAQAFADDRLNTATVYINTPTDLFDDVLSGLREELRLYAPEDEPTAVPIRIRTKRNPLPAINPKDDLDLSLTRWTLKAPDMAWPSQRLRSRGASLWDQPFLEASGEGRMSVLSLEQEEIIRSELLAVLRSARTRNGVYIRRRLTARNRACTNKIHPDVLTGPAYEQDSCLGSVAQDDMDSLAADVVKSFEDRVTYQQDPDPDTAEWIVGEHRPRGAELLDFERATHAHYAKADFNPDELLFARALDSADRGTWMRNPSTASLGYGIPLPVKVGESSTFYPDFLWWLDDAIWAIDTTGRHLLDEKVRGKLVDLDAPKIALVVRGEVDLASGVKLNRRGWTAVIARSGQSPLVEHGDDLRAVLEVLQ